MTTSTARRSRTAGRPLKSPLAAAHHNLATSGNCVEDAEGGQQDAALAEGQRLAIRDGKNPSGPVLLVSTADWRSFTSRLR